MGDVMERTRRRKSAAERRAQYARADARAFQHFLGGLEQLRDHRGSALSKAGASYLALLQQQQQQQPAASTFSTAPMSQPPSQVMPRPIKCWHGVECRYFKMGACRYHHDHGGPAALPLLCVPPRAEPDLSYESSTLLPAQPSTAVAHGTATAAETEGNHSAGDDVARDVVGDAARDDVARDDVAGDQCAPVVGDVVAFTRPIHSTSHAAGQVRQVCVDIGEQAIVVGTHDTDPDELKPTEVAVRSNTAERSNRFGDGRPLIVSVRQLQIVLKRPPNADQPD